MNWFSNLRSATKLLVSFGLILALLALVITTSTRGIRQRPALGRLPIPA